MATKLTFEQVKCYVENEGYLLLSTKYQNAKGHLDFLCPQGHKWSSSWSQFKQDHRCLTCAKLKQSKVYRLDFQTVKQQIEQSGYEVITQCYQNNKQRLELLCPQKHKCFVSWNNFQFGIRCAVCADKSRADSKRLDLVDIKRHMENEGYTLLSSTYANANTKLTLRCSQGHIYLVRWNDFQQGSRCPKCLKFMSHGEKRLGDLLEQAFLYHQVQAQSNIGFLGRQTVDYYIPALRMAFEYDGQQHFYPVTFGKISKGKAEDNFKRTRDLDANKDRLCKEHNIRLVRISFRDNLDIETVLNKCEEVQGG